MLRFAVRTVLLCLFLLLVFPALGWINYHQRLDSRAARCKVEAATNRVASAVLWLFGVRVRCSGRPADGPVLIAANHLTWLDTFVLHSVRTMSFVAKAEIDSWPVLRFMARAGGTIFHRRGSHDSSQDAVSAMVARLTSGRRVAIFPEGGVLPGAEIHHFHARMFRAAVDAGCPVQPVMIRYISGGERDDDVTFRSGENMTGNVIRMLARRGVEADVRFLPLIETAGRPRRALAEKAQAAIAKCYDGPPAGPGVKS